MTTSSQFGRPGAFLCPLKDSTNVLLAPVLPEDSERIRVGLTRMSSISKYLRFFTATPQLTDEQLHYLANVDQVNHVAWCALDPATPGLDGLGLGRFVRLENEPQVAEFAIAVIDALQNRGLGTILLAMLCSKALERGIRTLRGLVLPENEFVATWLIELGAKLRHGPDVNQVDLPLVSAATRLDLITSPRTRATEAT